MAIVPIANFDPNTGQYLRSTWAEADSAELTAPNTYRGVVDIDLQYHDVAAGRPVDMPPRPSKDHDFDYVNKRWVLNIERRAVLVRGERNLLLQATDWTQLADVPPATRALWQSYRQQLRDLPSRPGFPLTVEWPSPPTA